MSSAEKQQNVFISYPDVLVFFDLTKLYFFRTKIMDLDHKKLTNLQNP